MKQPRNKPQATIDPQHPALSAQRPLFVDNRDGNSMERAIRRHLQARRQEQAIPTNLNLPSDWLPSHWGNWMKDCATVVICCPSTKRRTVRFAGYSIYCTATKWK